MSIDLHAPLTLRGGAVLPNRLALAPLTNQQSHADGTLGEDELRFLERRAAGGFGLVSTCAAHVSAEGQAFDGQLGLFDDRHLPGLRRIAERVSAHGALPLAQLFDGGARCPSRLTGRQPRSASAFVEGRPDFEVPREATEAELHQVIDDFRSAAVRCRDAGFRGVEVHGAHGYLLCQFLSTVQNTRTDGWGGDLAGRFRLLAEVTRAVREAVPAPFVVGVRLSPEAMGQAQGLDLDESVEVAARLADLGVDYLHLSLWASKKNTAKRPDQHPVPLFRAAVDRRVALLAAGDVWTHGDAVALLERGADVVSVGRAAIVDPDWARRVVAPGFEPTRPPRTPEQLAEAGVGPEFVAYLRRFRLVS